MPSGDVVQYRSVPPGDRPAQRAHGPVPGTGVPAAAGWTFPRPGGPGTQAPARDRRGPGRRHGLEGAGLGLHRPGAGGRRRPVPPADGHALAAGAARRCPPADPHDLGPGPEHRRQFPHRHHLAGLQRGDHPAPLGPADGPGHPGLPGRRVRSGPGHGLHPGLRPQPHPGPGQLLVRLPARGDAGPLAPGGGPGAGAGGPGGGDELPRPPRPPPDSRGTASCWPWAPPPPWRPSRTWAPTAAASSAPTGRTPSPTPRPSPTPWACWPSSWSQAAWCAPSGS